jgi:hypothetical protein
MIIKDNFNKKDVDPLKDYCGIGKGSHSTDREIELEKQGFIKANMDNKVLQDLRDNHDDTDDDHGDKWDFFR